MVLKLSVFQTILQYIFFYLGLAHTSGVKGSIIIASNTFVAILVASLLFHQEKLTRRKVAACVIGFAGVVLVNLNGEGIGMSFRLDGEGFLLISVVAYAFASSLLKIYSKRGRPGNVKRLAVYGRRIGDDSGRVSFGGGRISKVTLPGTAVLIYLALVSSVAFSLWGILLSITRFLKSLFSVLPIRCSEFCYPH